MGNLKKAKFSKFLKTPFLKPPRPAHYGLTIISPYTGTEGGLAGASRRGTRLDPDYSIRRHSALAHYAPVPVGLQLSHPLPPPACI
jgi:hypothetical protein